MILLLKSKFVWNERENIDYKSVKSGLHPEVERLFLERNLGSIDALKNGLEAEDIWYNPFRFKDMQVAVNRIKQAIAANESILVYGDYDADGTTSTAILIRALRHLGAKANFYIPHRFFEGYGPNEDAFMQAVGEGYKLVITVDCGISGIAEAQILASHGVDLIITDHHHPKEEIPQAIAIIHPEYDESYPFDYLAGAGVALKIAEALRDGKLEDDDYMLAMFGTIGDIVDLTDENRSIVKKGLSAFKKTTLLGVLALLGVADINQYDVDETTVGFSICPRLNAPGRMDDASIVVDLLLAEDEFMATEYAREIDAMNSERKSVTSQITEDAVKLVESKDLNVLKAMVVYCSDWHEGVLGIVASRLVEKYGKATVVLTDNDEGLIKGSARAPAGFDILSALDANSELLAKYGGHVGAAGLSLATGDVSLLEVGLNLALENSMAIRQTAVDMQLELKELDFKWLDDVEQLAPFGQGNKRPVVKISDVRIKDVKRIGANYEHLKFIIYKEDAEIDTIFFSGAHIFIYLTPDVKFDVLCEVEINEWNGNKKLQARIIDIRCDDVQLLDLRNQKLEAEFAPLIEDGFMVDGVFDSKEMLRSVFRESGAKNVVLKRQIALTMPTRIQFAFVYRTARKHAPFGLTPEIVAYFEKGGVSKAMLVFIVRVFTEVALFRYDAGVVSLNDLDDKVDFKTAPSYVGRAAKVAMCEFLELGTVDEILKFMVD